jgi:hypothetical protein
LHTPARIRVNLFFEDPADLLQLSRTDAHVHADAHMRSQMSAYPIAALQEIRFHNADHDPVTQADRDIARPAQRKKGRAWFQ